MTEANPAEAISDGEIVAVSCWLLTKVVGTDCPFQSAVAEELKFDPLRVSVKLFAPAITLVGDNEPSTAAWLLLGGELASLPPPHPAKATVKLTSATAASVVFCFIR